MILEPVARSGGATGVSLVHRTDIDLTGVKDGLNPIFKTPDKFVQTSGLHQIAVYWQGRRLRVGRDYAVSESGGAGTGYDTITLSPWTARGFLPRTADELVADYYIDPAV